MSLGPGARLGPYEIVAAIGAGGMGEVYRARDPRLGRDVAIKVLPDLLAADPERLARFEREAQLLAALNHPHIASIYGVEATSGNGAGLDQPVRALILELVEGDTLADRIARGAIPLDEALPIARQICEALEAAHEQGIIHRDLKPSNIKITRGGVVKVLDFGLAKVAAVPDRGLAAAGHYSPSGSSGHDLTLSPTMASPAMMTGAGMLLGTAPYMAPEQAKGRPADNRSDIWASGCVLYEMLTGARAFDGDDASETMAAVLRGEPDWKALPPNVPAAVRTTLRRCLEKDPTQRLHDAADVRILLEDAAASPEMATARASSRRPVLIAAGVAFVAGAAIAAALVSRITATTPVRVQRFELAAPGSNGFALSSIDFAITPDGSAFVYTAESGDTTQLVLRRLDQSEGALMAGTAQALGPFFSPDGRQIGFEHVGDATLKIVSVAGGSVATLCHLPTNILKGASWGDDGGIVFSDAGVLYRVASTGGAPEKIAAPDPGKGEREYVWPEILPGSKAMLFTIVPTIQSAPMQIAARVFATGETTVVLGNGSSARYVPSGHILYAAGGRLTAAAFDPVRAELTGTPAPMPDAVGIRGTGGANFVVGADGTLIYARGDNVPFARRLIWRDRGGKALGTIAGEPLESGRYPRISPDGRRVAVTVGPSNGGQIWVHDVGTSNPPLKLTFEAHNVMPIWTPDGKRLVFQSSRSIGFRSLFSIAADGSQLEPQLLIDGGRDAVPVGWGSDGTVLLFSERDMQAGSHEFLVFRSSDRSRTPWLQTRFEEAEGAVSPDGRYVVYVSDQTGAAEVWIRTLAGAGSPVRVSAGGGHDPVWSRDGRELFFQSGGKLMSASIVQSGSALQVGAPTALFEGGFVRFTTAQPRTYDVAPDGRFLMLEAQATQSAPLEVVLNWTEALKRLAPAN